ncbi:MAG: Ig-like protein, group 1, partial [Paraglaciecola chathamensis]
INEQEVNLVVRLADTFNNPVPDGTAVSFTAEGGSIDGSCTTVSGACGVTWVSANPTVPDHRITILATAIGHETLFDSNGNNIYDDADGLGFNDGTDSGFGTSEYGQTGFLDMREAWRDDNENGERDNGEIFLDYNSDSEFNDIPNLDMQFNGPQCTGSRCGTGIASSIHVRQALVLVTSSSAAQIDIINNSAAIIASNYQGTTGSSAIPRNATQSFTLVFADTARQPIASGSNIIVNTSAGQLNGQTNLTMPITAVNAESRATFTLENDVTETTQATLSVVITSPSGVESATSAIVTLN